MSESMKKCCGLCPYSKVGTLFVHPERAEEFAYSTCNPFNDFVCNKTGVTVEEGPFEGDIMRGEKSLTCKGFESMQYYQNPDYFPEDYKPDPDAFDEPELMIDHHQEEWDRTHKVR